MMFLSLKGCLQSGHWSSFCSTVSSIWSDFLRPPPSWPGFLPRFFMRLRVRREGLNLGLSPPEPGGLLPQVHCRTKASSSAILFAWSSSNVRNRDTSVNASSRSSICFSALKFQHKMNWNGSFYQFTRVLLNLFPKNSIWSKYFVDTKILRFQAFKVDDSQRSHTEARAKLSSFPIISAM